VRVILVHEGGRSSSASRNHSDCHHTVIVYQDGRWGRGCARGGRRGVETLTFIIRYSALSVSEVLVSGNIPVIRVELLIHQFVGLERGELAFRHRAFRVVLPTPTSINLPTPLNRAWTHRSIESG
jgi:hypothetical protein